MKIDTIYLDMDGVLADFDGEIKRRTGVDRADFHHLPENQWSEKDRQTDFLVRQEMGKEDFWPSLPKMPGAIGLIRTCWNAGCNVYILTATPRLTEWRDRIATQKRDWAWTNTGVYNVPVITCLRAQKSSYSGPGKVLIDDLKVNCEEWEAAGGAAIHYKSAEQAIKELEKLMNDECQCQTCTLEDIELEAPKPLYDSFGNKAPTPTEWFAGTTFKEPEFAPNPAEKRMKAEYERNMEFIDSLTSEQRKQLPLTTGVLDYFPLALLYVAKVSKTGNDKHNPGEPLDWARGKSTDQADTIGRHLLTRKIKGSDGILHAGNLAWRALADLQLLIEDQIAKGENPFA